MSGFIRKNTIVAVLFFFTTILTVASAQAITWNDPNLDSGTHNVSEQSTSTSVAVSWDAMTPTGGSTAGSYTWVWDDAATTAISATTNPTEPISGNTSGLTATRTLSTGTWYFHIRAVDSGLNWTTTKHFGPIIIDTTPSPTVSLISPSTGKNNLDTIDVTITGTRFKKLDDSSFTNVSAQIGNATLSNVTVVSATSITATYAINNKTADAYNVTVTTDWGTSEPLADGFTVSNPAPTVTAISPTSGGNGTARSVTITGTGFLSTATVPVAAAKPTVQMRDPANPDRNFSLTNITVVTKTSITATVPSDKTVGTYDIVVANNDSQSGTLTDGYQVKLPAPTISDVSPSSGTNDNSTTITITGTNFVESGSTTVTLGDSISCSSVTFLSTTSLTASVPSNQTKGTYDVKVTNPDGQIATSTDAFSVTYPDATVTGISPATMSNNQSKLVTITGTKFRTGATVQIGTTTCSTPTLDSENPTTELTCTVPASMDPDTYDVKVTNLGASVGTLSQGFEVTLPPPTITDVSPSSGTNDGTTTITVTGTNFIAGSNTAVTLGDSISCSSINVSSTTSMTAVVPSNQTKGTYDVKVTNPDGQFATSTDAFSVTYPDATVSGISPATMTNNQSKLVTISGTKFRTGATVQIGTTTCSTPTLDSENPTTQLTCTVPASMDPDTYDVKVTNVGASAGTLSQGFEVTLPAPTITDVSPSSGTNDNATSITITGTNFVGSGSTSVTLGDSISCSSIVVASATSITASVPAEQTVGTYDVKVTNPDGQIATSADAFTVNNPTPTFTTITPSSMTNNSSQAVTIVGTKFRSGITVKIGTTSCTGVTRDTENPTTQLTCTVPASMTAATYNVVLTNVGADPATATDEFTVNSATTTVALTYSASDADNVPEGNLTIEATFTSSQSNAPNISIDQQGTTDITEQDLTATADGAVWTYTYAVQAADGGEYVDGEATVTIKNSGGSTVNITSGSSFTIDSTSLSASLAYNQGGNTTGSTKDGVVTITATLNTAVTNPPKISINQTGSTDITDANMSGSGTSWTYDYTVVADDGSAYRDGAATISLKDADNSDAAIPIGSGSTFTIDTVAPTVALTYAQSSNTSGPFKVGSMTVTATFSETPAGTPQIAINQQGSTDIAAIDMTGSARVWTHAYTVVAATGDTYVDGVATVTISNGADTAGNANATASNNTFTTDTTAPTVSITYDQGGDTTSPFDSGSLTITATFSETPAGTPQIAIDQAGTTDISATNMTGSGTTWTYAYTVVAETGDTYEDGTATVTISSGTDTAGNANATASNNTFVINTVAPQVTSATYIDETHVDVLFSEAVTGATTAGNYTIAGLTVSAAADQGSNTYRLTMSTATGGQTYTVTVSTSITDVAGKALDSNNNTADFVSGTLGDINSDSSINITDVLLCIDYIFGAATPNAQQYFSANLDTNNSAINITDLLAIIDIIFGN